MRGRSRAWAEAPSCSSRDRADAADGRALPGALRRRVAVLHSALTEAERRDERERIVAGEAPSRRRRPLGGLRAGSSTRPRRRRRGARRLVQAGVGSALRRTHGRGQARGARGSGRGLRERDAAPESWARLERLELPARIGAPLPTVKLVDLRREAGYPLSAPLLAELAGGRGARRARDPPPQPARHLGRDPLPVVRYDAALPELRHRAHAARRLTASLPPLRLLDRAAGVVPRVRIGGARADRCGNAAARGRARAPAPRARADPPRRGYGGAPRVRSARRSSASQRSLRRAHRDADGREGAPLRRGRGRRRGGRRRGPRVPGLPLGGADVPARDPARRPERPRRARAR